MFLHKWSSNVAIMQHVNWQIFSPQQKTEVDGKHVQAVICSTSKVMSDWPELTTASTAGELSPTTSREGHLDEENTISWPILQTILSLTTQLKKRRLPMLTWEFWHYIQGPASQYPDPSGCRERMRKSAASWLVKTFDRSLILLPLVGLDKEMQVELVHVVQDMMAECSDMVMVDLLL